MSQGRITEKQKEILEYIKETILKKGYPPAVREICEAVNLKSTSSVHSHLETLEKNGYIRRDPTKPRTIEILDDDFALTRREMENMNGENKTTIVNKTIKTGITFGSALAMVISYTTWHSVGWAIFHGLLSWVYVVCFVLRY